MIIVLAEASGVQIGGRNLYGNIVASVCRQASGASSAACVQWPMSASEPKAGQKCALLQSDRCSALWHSAANAESAHFGLCSCTLAALLCGPGALMEKS